MSNIKVNWDKLDRHASSMERCARVANGIANDVQNVRNTLRLSDEVMASIKAGLDKDIQTLNDIQRSFADFSSKLHDISSNYRTTEANLSSAGAGGGGGGGSW